jgi:hypothetical protein
MRKLHFISGKQLIITIENEDICQLYRDTCCTALFSTYVSYRVTYTIYREVACNTQV